MVELAGKVSVYRDVYWDNGLGIMVSRGSSNKAMSKKILAFHGVKKILPGTTPAGLGFDEPGRINLTFRVL